MKYNMLTKVALAGFAFLAIAGCVQPTPYQPSIGPDGAGYSDRQLAANRYRIAFNGNSVTSREAVEDYLLRRAAEVTLQSGFSYFMFDTRNTEARTDYYSNFMARWPGLRFSPGFWYWHSWNYDPFGYDMFGYDRFGPERIDSETRYRAYAEIVMLTPEQAATEPTALYAQDVLAHVAPQGGAAKTP